ncbi:allophanate hydrolase-related protein [Paraburkholderia tuberum]|uniref:allophanate hydrolase-related protein n=1 Tax=Paraburkholderia tuberum TaxID=157910 RepID=UPI003CC5E52B
MPGKDFLPASPAWHSCCEHELKLVFKIELMLPDAFFKVRALLESYATKSTTPRDIVDTVIARIEASCRPEVWISRVSFGAFVAHVPAPLGIGSVQTADGLIVKGFISEPSAVAPGSGARDITAFGGWRAWLATAAGTQAQSDRQF